MIGRKTTALQQPKVVSERLGFDLSHQARFADACFPANQGDTSLPLSCSINQQMKGGKNVCPADQGRTRKSQCVHGVGSRWHTEETLCFWAESKSFLPDYPLSPSSLSRVHRLPG